MNERLEDLKDKKDILLTDKDEIVSKLTTLHSVNQLTTEKLQDRQAEQSDIKRNIADMKEQIEQWKKEAEAEEENKKRLDV